MLSVRDGLDYAREEVEHIVDLTEEIAAKNDHEWDGMNILVTRLREALALLTEPLPPDVAAAIEQAEQDELEYDE